MFNPTSQDNITEIRVANSLQPGAITTARWIKPPEKCTKNQATTHLVLHIKTRLATNSLIRLGILIASTWVMARKSLQEAKQCLKCQKLGTSHMAAQCNQIFDTCGACARNDHWTKECTVNDLSLYKCVNCNRSSHVSWDQKCPAFMEYNDRLQQKSADTNMHYYVSSRDPQSWETTTTINDCKQNPTSIPPISRFRPSTFNLHCLNHSPQHNPITSTSMHRLTQNNITSDNSQWGRSQACNLAIRSTHSTDSTCVINIG